MESKKTNIAQWLLSIPKVPNEWETFFEYELPEYINRVYDIDKKIKSLLEKLSVLANGEELLWAGDKLQEVYSIRKSIGVYHVPGVIESNTFLKFQYPLWTKYSIGLNDNSNSKYVRITSYTSGYEWMDYFGDRKITDRDTYLVVSLSDEGVSYLNSIDKEVTSRTTTV